MSRYTFELWNDTDTESPLSYGSEVRMVVLHRHYVDPSEGACGTTPEQVDRWARKHARSWHILPLWLYDHSGTVYRAGETNPFSCRWDSGRVGIVAVRRRAIKGMTAEQVAEHLDSVCETYTAWANGDCYGYDVKDSAGDVVDSCGGFIGRDVAEQAAQEAIKHRTKAA
jgi:hypothetical protein